MGSRRSKQYGFFGLLWRLVAAGALVLGLSAIGGYYAVYYLVRAPEMDTPDLLTLPLEGAIERASDEGFAVRIVEHEQSTALAPSHVLAQRPSPRMKIKRGGTILLTLSAAPGTRQVAATP